MKAREHSGVSGNAWSGREDRDSSVVGTFCHDIISVTGTVRRKMKPVRRVEKYRFAKSDSTNGSMSDRRSRGMDQNATASFRQE